ncbi:MAG TPA: nuclear transport factor 2 family protein [Acidimicrobiales bacterium]|nr:nuclear transport factor 2 family protein [Acidimicrobiales bacterium]
MTDPEIQDLRQKIDYLLDRQAILDCIASHAHGHDRHDADVITAAYHDDGFDEHGKAINPGPKYAAWINPVHAAGSQGHLHNITTHTVEIDGDTAHAESYVLVALLNPDGETARFINGRYIDRLEKRDGTWRIAVRRSTVEVMVTADASGLQNPVFKDQGYSKGTRDRRDLSYVRPLQIDTPAPELW